MRARLLVCCMVLAVSVLPIHAQTWNAEEQEIWRLEEQQWKMSAAEDLTWIETMVHPKAMIWGDDWPSPTNRASLSRWQKYDAASGTTLEQELFPLSITVTGNVAVAHYRYRAAREDHKKEREIVTGRYTDVFVKEGGKWLFITWTGGDDPKK